MSPQPTLKADGVRGGHPTLIPSGRDQETPSLQDNRSRLKAWLAAGEVRLQPLTYPQRELWETSPVPANDAENNICAIIRVRGALTPGGSEAALQKVVDRQEVFRLSFLPGKTQPMQFIRTSGKPALQFQELSPSQRSAPAIEDLAREIFQQPFNLVQGPLYQAKVLSLGGDDHVLILSIHHAIADGWTLGVFVEDLFAAYVLGLRGSEAALPPVPLSYTEWGAAERSFWQGAQIEQRADYWKHHLGGVSRLWKESACGVLKRHVTTVPPVLGRAVRDLSRRYGATLFSTLLTAFQITLSKWTGNDDIIVGTPVANRNKQAVRQTAGYCSGIVPLRGRIDTAHSFADTLRGVHQSSVESFANAMPFAELVRMLGCPTAPGYNPLFQVRFALQNHPVPDVEMPGLALQLNMRSTGTSRFDLACEVNEHGEGLEVAWLFRDRMFGEDDINRVSCMFLSVLAGVCQTPEILILSLMNQQR